MRTHMYCPLEYVCYDDGCHLRKYAMNPCQCDVTQTTHILSEVAIAIDKMHMAGHIDMWCKTKPVILAC